MRIFPTCSTGTKSFNQVYPIGEVVRIEDIFEYVAEDNSIFLQKHIYVSELTEQNKPKEGFGIHYIFLRARRKYAMPRTSLVF